MKKTLLFGLIAASLGFTACSSEDDNVLSKENEILGNKTPKKGMVLNATVEQPADTRATIDNWQFAFANGDEITVTNSVVASGTYYTFTSDGTNFKSENAETTATAANWFAYFPSNSINLTGQAGTLASVANLYALAGTTASATTGADGLTIPMSAKVAILKIENYKGDINIRVKTSATDYVTGLTAKSGEAGFDVETSTTPTSLLTTTTTGDYYVAVPAGVQFSVMDGLDEIKSTVSTGLTAGKYYTLTIGTPLTLTALESSTVNIGYTDFQYRTTGQTEWTDYSSGTNISLNTDEYVQFRGKPSSTSTEVSQEFVMTGSFNASGNVMSLLYGHEMGNNAFQGLFNGCTGLKSASTLLLPAATLTQYCYRYMFFNCTNLTAVPALPAENLAEECYCQMFQGCTSLTTAPTALPATTLAASCYEKMFEGCTNLTAAPALPAENLANYCYFNMFYGCTSLTTAPTTLPATTLATWCYNSMFEGCTSLETAPTLPAITEGANNCLYQMFKDCSKLKSITVNFTSWAIGSYATFQWLEGAGASGVKTFTCPAALCTESTVPRDNDHVPSGWTVVNP